jgi:hypothetical protein
MSLPASISVSFDFSQGATFGFPFTIGDAKNGILGVSQLAGSTVPEPIVDLTPNVYDIKINRGRNIPTDQYTAGNAIIRVLDPLSYFSPQNPASPYFGFLTPLRKIRVAATTATTQAFLFSGYVTEYRYTYPQGQETAYVDIYATDAFRLFQLASIGTVADSGNGQDTGTRVNRILSQMSFPSSMRTISTGNSLCQADPATTRTGLDALKNAEFTEAGALYVNGAGTVVFKSRNEVVSSISGTPIEFNQTGGILYQNLVFAFNDQLIINGAKFKRIGGVSQEYYNTASIARYFLHQQNQENLVSQTDADVANLAATYVATRQETSLRIDKMTVNLQDTSVPTDTMINLDYFSNVRIQNVQPDGSLIVKTLQCQGLEWHINPKTFTCTVTTLENITDGFVIGSSERGIIGVSAMTY